MSWDKKFEWPDLPMPLFEFMDRNYMDKECPPIPPRRELLNIYQAKELYRICCENDFYESPSCKGFRYFITLVISQDGSVYLEILAKENQKRNKEVYPISSLQLLYFRIKFMLLRKWSLKCSPVVSIGYPNLYFLEFVSERKYHFIACEQGAIWHKRRCKKLFFSIRTFKNLLAKTSSRLGNTSKSEFVDHICKKIL